MKELIKIQDYNSIPAVRATDLHEFLQSETRYNDWISRRLEKYSFIEGEDFYLFLSKTNGRPEKEYYLTIDTAKELAMVENNDKGREIRKYFIAVENTYRVEKVLKKQIRDKSKEVRNSFTDTLRNHGYTKQGHFIQTTKQMKDALGISCKKDEMSGTQLKIVTAAELLAEVNIEQSGSTGYHEVNPICLDCCEAVSKVVENKNQIMQGG